MCSSIKDTWTAIGNTATEDNNRAGLAARSIHDRREAFMNQRDNLLKLLKRQGYEYIPVGFNLCPCLENVYRDAEGSEAPYDEHFSFPWRNLPPVASMNHDALAYEKYHSEVPKDNFWIDSIGVGHRKTPTSLHMSQMFHPLANADSLEQIASYPLPQYNVDDFHALKDSADQIHTSGYASRGVMVCTVWESAWYIRGMENLMADMMTDEPMAELLLDRVTEMAIGKAAIFAKAGADIILLGDDIGMQQTVMMNPELYRHWLKPRLRQVINAAKVINPTVLVHYHSCGFIEPFIPDLIEAGVDVLNPVQPECMDFEKIHAEYAGALSFHGTIGTQTTMPFGTAGDVAAAVRRNLDIAGKRGGLFPAPTHMLEPEVPWVNVLAYVKTCKEYA
jgi:uroporphyrinogen decarboxylase